MNPIDCYSVPVWLLLDLHPGLLDFDIYVMLQCWTNEEVVEGFDFWQIESVILI